MSKDNILDLIDNLENEDLKENFVLKICLITAELTKLFKTKQISEIKYNIYLAKIFSFLVFMMQKNNPNLSISLIEKLFENVLESKFLNLKDIVVINDTIFLEELVDDDQISCYEFSSCLENSYKEINNLSFYLNNWENEFDLKLKGENSLGYDLTRDNYLETINFVANSLNQILEKSFKEKNISKVVELKNINLDYKDLSVKIYLDHNINQIFGKIKEAKPTTIKMIVIFNSFEIHYFEIVQFIKDDKVSWIGCEIKPRIWRLSDGLESEKGEKRLSKGSI